MNTMPDELVLELTGYRPGDLSERDEALIRERARLRWVKLLAVANGNATTDPVAYLVDWADIGEGTAQSLFYGDEAREHMEGAVRFGWNARKRLAKVTPLYASPAASRTSQPNAAAQEQQAGWISVDEQLPPAFTHVLAYGLPDCTSMDKAKHVYITFVSTHPLEVVGDEEIECWQPLPPAPGPTGMGSVGLPSGRGEGGHADQA